MRKVNIAPGVDSSVLGFGCAPILGAVGAKTAQRALGCALDEGINHFDIARSYGYGEAEAFLGKFFKGRRDEVVIASKFGIRATWKAGLLRPLKPAVRTLRALRSRGGGCKSGGCDAQANTAPEAAEIAAPRNDPFHERIAITPKAMVESLDKSLSALRCDYLDVLMVHEPTGAIERMDDLAAKAEELKQQGKIKAWGLAFDWDTADVHESVFDRFDVFNLTTHPRLRITAGHSSNDAMRLIFSFLPSGSAKIYHLPRFCRSSGRISRTVWCFARCSIPSTSRPMLSWHKN